MELYYSKSKISQAIRLNNLGHLSSYFLFIFFSELSPVSLCGLWYLLSCRYFYSLGHQPTFPTIPWSAAFVGLPGNFPYPAGPALLVLFNLYSAQIICAFSLPLLHFWSKYAGKTGSLSAVKCVEAKEPGKTEATLIGTDVPRDVAQLLLVYIAFSGVKVSCLLREFYWVLGKTRVIFRFSVLS